MKTPRSIALWMVLAIVAIGLFAIWDERREADARLHDFAHEQVTIARATAALLDANRGGDTNVLAALARIEEPGNLLVLIETPAGGAFETTTGKIANASPIMQALASGLDAVRLSRSESADLGLPARTSMAGIATLNASREANRPRAIAVVASALRERDREIRAQWRLVLGFLLASGFVLAFGALALRTQKKELDLTRELAIADAVRTRDERLVKADKLATLGALATGIAHEVSTPLGVIVGRAEQLGPRVEGDERAKKALTAISEQADRIGTIVRGFLSLARGEAVRLEHSGPRSIATDAIELVDHRFEKANVALKLHTDDALPNIACDPKLFTQVLVNLLLNACDACEAEGNVTLEVAKMNDRIVFTVTDDGAGITSEAAARATEPFFTTKSPGKGTGLGLAIANEIVLHHRGQLSVAPRKDGVRGTVACVDVAAEET